MGFGSNFPPNVATVAPDKADPWKEWHERSLSERMSTLTPLFRHEAIPQFRHEAIPEFRHEASGTRWMHSKLSYGRSGLGRSRDSW